MVAHCIQPDGAVPFSFVTCLSSREVFDGILLASPVRGSGTVHELIAVANCPSAADGLNVGLERAKHEWVVWVHEDVYLPNGWDWCLANQLCEAERRFGPIGVAYTLIKTPFDPPFPSFPLVVRSYFAFYSGVDYSPQEFTQEGTEDKEENRNRLESE
jgi:hypothetical protein